MSSRFILFILHALYRLCIIASRILEGDVEDDSGLHAIRGTWSQRPTNLDGPAIPVLRLHVIRLYIDVTGVVVDRLGAAKAGVIHSPPEALHAVILLARVVKS